MTPVLIHAIRPPMMRATIIIRTAEKDGRIVDLVDVPSIDEQTVRATLEAIQERHAGKVIDTSQIDLARQAMAA